MKNKFKLFIICIMLMIIELSFSFATINVAAVTNNSDREVLFISSYSYEWPAVGLQIKGIKNKIGNKAGIHYMFMDTKNVSTETAESVLSTELEQVMKKNKFDLVIVGDDAAFNYVLKNRNSYFSDMPIIYEGINSLETINSVAKDPLIRGVAEIFPLKETIEAASRLQPDAKRIVAVLDDTVTGQGSREQFYALKNQFKAFEFGEIDCSKLSKNEIQNEVKKLDKKMILVYLMFSNDVDGNVYRYDLAVKTIYNASTIPVYKPDEAGIGGGIFGGCVISFTEMGEKAGEMASKILDGTLPNKLNNVTMSGRNMYDASLLEKYEFKKVDFPSDTIFINDSLSVLEIDRTTMIYLIIITLTIIFLIIYLIQRKSNKKIKKNNIELKHALEVADQATEAKMSFFSEINHDMRTPLNAVINYANLAADENIEPEVKDYLEKIKISGKLLLDLINNALLVSKINSGKLQISPKPVELHMLYDNILVPVKAEAMKKNIKLNIKINADEHRVVVADDLNVQKIILNLLSNAIKYTNDGGNVDFSFTYNDGTVAIIVSDNGVGISESFLPHVFDPFAQERQNGTEPNGTGLGLAIVKDLIELMNGEISVESKKGKGTTFYVTLHFKTADSEIEIETINGNLDNNIEYSRMEGKKVLVCEDNQINRDIIKSLLATRKITADFADNGKVAVDLFSDSSLDEYYVVLMDIRMPVMDGYAATTEIRKLKRHDARHIPIIALTANAFQEDIEKCFEAGMNGYVAKPIEPEKLFKEIYRSKEEK